MTISRALSTRLQKDAQAPSFWYVPKGKTVSEDNWELIAKHLRVLNEFRKTPWDEAQPKFVERLQQENLIDPYKEVQKGFSAVGRMQLPVWRLLGLAWVNEQNIPEVTQIGDRFVKANNPKRRKILTMQLHRYQFSNPTTQKHFSDFATFPVLGLYRLLNECSGKLSWDEFRLFGTRVRSFDDAYQLANVVEDWRECTPDEKKVF